MSIDSKKVKYFWESRMKKFGEISPESFGNLEDNPELLKIKIEKERKKVFEYLSINKDMRVLELGAGIGTWSALLAKKAREVYAIEYSEQILKMGQVKMKEQGVDNVHYVHMPAQEFQSKIKFDLIFISGLFVCLNDDEYTQLFANIPSYSKKGTRLLLRDGTGVRGRFEINNKFSQALGKYYSGIYRMRQTYINDFRDIGFTLLKDEDMFEEGSVLNKYPETRLRVYLFEKNK